MEREWATASIRDHRRGGSKLVRGRHVAGCCRPLVSIQGHLANDGARMRLIAPETKESFIVSAIGLAVCLALSVAFAVVLFVVSPLVVLRDLLRKSRR